MDDRLTRVRERVGQRLVTLCDAEEARAAAIHPSYAQLWQAIRLQIVSGGKYLRPYLVELSYAAYGGTDDITDLAAAWEIMHIGLLLHDDVIDRDYLRHSQPNVAGQYLDRYDSEHHAQMAGLLAGDLVLAAARRLLTSKVLLDIFDEALFSVIGGELLDMEASIGASDATPEAVAVAKTASYSMIGPLLSGAAATGATDEAALRELGRVWGIGFQLADDLLVFSDEAGKDVASDLREHKRSILFDVYIQSLPKAERHKIELTLADNPTADVAYLSHIQNPEQLQAIAQKKLRAYARDADQIITSLAIDPTYRAEFQAVTKKLFFRSS